MTSDGTDFVMDGLTSSLTMLKKLLEEMVCFCSDLSSDARNCAFFPVE